MTRPPVLRLATIVSRGCVCIAAVVSATVACGDTRKIAPEQQDRVSSSPTTNVGFFANLPKDFHAPDADDQVGWRLLAEYGALFVARGGVTLPPAVTFPDEASVAGWQAKLATRQETIGGVSVELQAPAMEALLAARAEAAERRLRITPRSRDAARRDYRMTAKPWLSRVHRGVDHWVRQGRLSPQEAARLRSLSPRDQVPEILRLEKQGLYFSSDRSKSILNSGAAPGSSQHLSLLALDVKEHESPRVRAILARHGWFQTVVSDLPHFTYLGAKEHELSMLGLKMVTVGKRSFWIPEIPASGMAVGK